MLLFFAYSYLFFQFYLFGQNQEGAFRHGRYRRTLYQCLDYRLYQRLSKPLKGVNIVKGRKLLVR